MKNLKLEFLSAFTFGLLLLTQFSFAQGSSNCSLGNGYSGEFPIVFDSIAEIEINGVTFNTDVIITNPVGFELDTFTIVLPGCLKPAVAFGSNLPLTFETDIASDITDLNNWFNSPSTTDLEFTIKTLKQNIGPSYYISFLHYTPGSTSAGGNGRTSYTLSHDPPSGGGAIPIIPDHLGSELSFNPTTDKIVNIPTITHPNFTPSAQIDYSKRVITLEMNYNEGAGLIPWFNDAAAGVSGLEKTMSISETTDGVTATSTEDFFNVLPFKYEILTGFSLNTKVVVRMQFVYGCN